MTNGKKVGRYRIVAKLGEGGAGTVYRAVDTRLGRIVALKFLHERFADSQKLRSRFRREGLIGAALSHPNICTIYDFDTHEGRPFIVMEFLRGRPLSECLLDGQLSTPRLLEVAVHLANALGKAHGCGVVHRDLKPANVFVTDDGCTKLLDFGVAKPVALVSSMSPAQLTDPGANAGTGRVVGTICYMSPEQARGEDLDGRSDLFALGILLYEAATGVLPFEAETSALVVERILHVDPPSPLYLNPTLPADLVHVIAKALRKSRRARYQAADEILDDLFDLRTYPVAAVRAPSARRGGNVNGLEGPAVEGRDVGLLTDGSVLARATHGPYSILSSPLTRTDRELPLSLRS